MVTTSCRSAR